MMENKAFLVPILLLEPNCELSNCSSLFYGYEFENFSGAFTWDKLIRLINLWSLILGNDVRVDLDHAPGTYPE